MSRITAETAVPGARERWAEFGRRRTIYFATLAAPILAGALALLFDRLVGLGGLRAWIVPLVLAFGLAWAALAVSAWWRVTRWPCPRCGKPYLFDRSVLSARARACAHCRLPAPRRG
jgi:hypothetical protein